MHMKRTADRLFGDNYRWSVLGAGKNQMAIAAMSAAMGGHVRVGLEDNIYLDKGVYGSNAQLVEKAIKIIGLLGHEIATPQEARQMLKLRNHA